MNALAYVCVVTFLAGVVVGVVRLAITEARRIESWNRRLAQPLHPSVRRAIVDQPRGERVTLIPPPGPYDWDADDEGDADGAA